MLRKKDYSGGVKLHMKGGQPNSKSVVSWLTQN